MPNSGVSDQQFMSDFEMHGPEWQSRAYPQVLVSVYRRRRRLEKKYSTELIPPTKRFQPVNESVGRKHAEVKNGHVLIGSDAHYWPNDISTAHAAFVHFCKELNPGS